MGSEAAILSCCYWPAGRQSHLVAAIGFRKFKPGHAQEQHRLSACFYLRGMAQHAGIRRHAYACSINAGSIGLIKAGVQCVGAPRFLLATS
jgi:hypothetical protein